MHESVVKISDGGQSAPSVSWWRHWQASARAWLGVLAVIMALAWSVGTAFADSVPVVTGISPASAVLSDGDSAFTMISGSGFKGSWNDDSRVSVSMGGQVQPYASIFDDGTILVVLTTPATTGTLDITVTTPAGTSAISSADKFTWLPDPSSDATLSGLTTSAGSFAPPFGSLSLNPNPATACNVTYQLQVPYSAETITVTPTASDSAASVAVNGTSVNSNATSGAISLGVGTTPNAVMIVVTAADTSTKTYCITATRDAAPVTAPFSGLSISPGMLDQSFSDTRNNYTATLSYADSSATISWTPVYPTATVTVYYTVGSDPSVTNVTPIGNSATIPLTAGLVSKVTIRSTPAGGSVTEIYQVNVTRAVPQPTITSISPALGPITGGTSVTITGTGFTGVPAVTFGTNAATGVSVGSDTQISATAPAGAHGKVDVSVTTPGGTATLPLGYAYVTAPTVSPVSASVAANSSGNAVTLAFSGDAAASVAVATQPGHGTASASGTSITYTPTAGYSGPDSFTYTATNPGGTSAAATVTIGVTGPALVLSPPAGTLPAGTVATAYSQTVTASAGSGSYQYVVSSGMLPGGLSLNASTGVISGTPTSAGDFDFTVKVTDAGLGIGEAAYQIAVSEQAPVADAVGATVAANSSANPITLILSGGAAASVAVATQPGHGTASASGTSITYTPTAGYSGPDSFTYTATNPGGTSAAATVTISVTPAPALTLSPADGALPQAVAGEAYSAGITATGATGALVYNLSIGKLPDGLNLNTSSGALTGPLASGAAVGEYSFTITAHDNGGGGSISGNYTLRVIAQAVTATNKTQDVPAGADPTNVDLTQGATGGPFTGAAIVSITPSAAGAAQIVAGPTGPGFYLKFTRTPGFSGRAVVDFTLTGAVGTSNTGSVTYNFAIDAAAATSQVDSLVHGFVAERQAMLADSIKLPALLDRRGMSAASTPIAARISPDGNEGLALSFATSLARMRAYQAAADLAAGLPGVVEPPRFNVWASGIAQIYTSADNGGRWGNFSLFSSGADYLLNDRALVGLSFHLDHMTDPTDADTQLTGNGWLAGPYGSFEIAKGIFLDTNLLYGGSSNSIDTAGLSGAFDTHRWMSDTSLYGQWRLDAATTLTPKLRVVYLNEAVADYEVANDVGAVVAMPGFTEHQLRTSLGVELTHELLLDNGLKLIPTVGVTAGVSALDETAAFGSFTTGLRLADGQNWSIDAGLLVNIDGNSNKSVGGKLGVEGHF